MCVAVCQTHHPKQDSEKQRAATATFGEKQRPHAEVDDFASIYEPLSKEPGIGQASGFQWSYQTYYGHLRTFDTNGTVKGPRIRERQRSGDGW